MVLWSIVAFFFLPCGWPFGGLCCYIFRPSGGCMSRVAYRTGVQQADKESTPRSPDQSRDFCGDFAQSSQVLPGNFATPGAPRKLRDLQGLPGRPARGKIGRVWQPASTAEFRFSNTPKCECYTLWLGEFSTPILVKIGSAGRIRSPLKLTD